MIYTFLDYNYKYHMYPHDANNIGQPNPYKSADFYAISIDEIRGWIYAPKNLRCRSRNSIAERQQKGGRNLQITTETLGEHRRAQCDPFNGFRELLEVLKAVNFS
jgi:hypothetical protein